MRTSEALGTAKETVMLPVPAALRARDSVTVPEAGARGLPVAQSPATRETYVEGLPAREGGEGREKARVTCAAEGAGRSAGRGRWGSAAVQFY